ncbi:MAG: hypothetical protein WC362_01490 [Methanoregula sp.]|jgi:predicted amidophosphoribosyltransferase
MPDRTHHFKCQKCGHADREFHDVCPVCGRPFFRDYVDTQVHPRDPDLAGVVTSKFRARIFLVLMLAGIGVSLFFAFRPVPGI